MTECWAEGELRAYLDRELAPDQMAQASAHLDQCAACRGLTEELEERAARVAGWMAALPTAETPVWAPRVVPMPPRRAPWKRVAVVGGLGALAAGLVLLGVALGRREQPVVVVRNPEPAVVEPAASALAPVPESVPESEAAPAPKSAAWTRRATTASARRRPQAAQPTYYVALDDEPIETGVVVRMALDRGAIQADVIVGPDGRARAFRLVNDKSH